MPWIDSLDWSALNALRRYPIREGASAVSTDGYFSLPDDLIVDLTLSASSDVTKRFHVSRLFNKLSSVVIEISDDAGAVVGTFSVDEATHTQDKVYYLTETNLFVGANGKMTVGSLTGISHQPAGNFSFLLSATEFEPRTIIPGIQGVDRIRFVDPLAGESSLTGDVTLRSRTNLRFSFDDGEVTGNRVILDAGDNLGLNKECATSNCIQSINGVVPDGVGNLSLLGIDCLAITSPGQYTLNLADTCCTPCSGCDDLEELTRRLTSLENKFLDLRGVYNNVDTQLTTYLATINSNCAC